MFSRRAQAITLFAALVVIYNSNGREIGSVDTQPAKYLASGLALRHTLDLDALVAERPGLAERTAFQQDRAGRWRSAYPILSGLLAGVPATLLHTMGWVDMGAPLAANLVAVLTASSLTAGAVVLVFLSLTRVVTTRHALWTALGLGLGTNYWAGVSQTLGQHESVAFGMGLALWSLWRTSTPSSGHLALGALGLAMAGAARPQVSPMIAVLAAALVWRVGWRRAAWPLAILAGVGLGQIGLNVWWFGSPFGAMLLTEAVHPDVHGVTGSLAAQPWMNAVALVISPSRGLLIYSPVVALAFLGMARSWRRPDLHWLGAAAAVQFISYACYSVWWGGHSFGPRYLLDVLVLLAPFAAIGVASVAQRPMAGAAAVVLLVWSVSVSALGAFVYPNDRWNTDPENVDRHHERLWDWHDSQISRTYLSPASPQNFNLFQRATIRRDVP